MITFSTKIHRFGKPSDKNAWSYIEITQRLAKQLNPGCKKSFRVKGMLDQYKIAKAALLPLGEGKFMLPMNAAIRKGTGKAAGDSVKVKLEVDARPIPLSRDLVNCLRDEPHAYTFFKGLTRGHQQYFSNWVDSAKTAQTKTKRITMAVVALGSRQGFSEMNQSNKRTTEPV
jgi:hypothetical protein